MATTQKFLSYAGLEKFWALIKTKFASSLDVAVTETGAVFTLSDANGNTLSTENIPAASTSGAGLMTKAHVEALNAVGADIQTAIKFEGMQFGGNDATLVGKKANVGLQYNSTNKHLEIIDLNSADNTVLTFMDAQDFVKDGLITASDVVENNGQVQLSLTFTYVDGTTDTKFINVTDLVSQYSAGNGLQLLSEAGSGMDDTKHTGTFAIKLVEGEKYLSVTGAGLATTETLMSDVDDKISAAEGRAAEDAQDKADAAQAAAIGAAATDATTKANAAKEAAIAAAATDATTKANAAQAAAEATAAADATTKANAAQAAAEKTAKDYTDQEITKLTENGVADALDAAKAYTDQEIGKVNQDITKINNKIGTVTEGETVVSMISKAQAAAEATAAADATSKADAAQAAAIAAAATDATNKADAAQAAAIAAAATDATTKANAAQAAAEATAAADATAKANAAQAAAEKTAKDYTDAEIKKLTDNGVANALKDAKAYTDQEIGKVNTKIGTVTEGETVVSMISKAEAAAKSHAETKAGEALTSAKSYTDAEIVKVNKTITDLDSTLTAVTHVTSGEGDAAVTTLKFNSTVSQADGLVSATPAYDYEISTISLAEIAALVG